MATILVNFSRGNVKRSSSLTVSYTLTKSLCALGSLDSACPHGDVRCPRLDHFPYDSLSAASVPGLGTGGHPGAGHPLLGGDCSPVGGWAPGATEALIVGFIFGLLFLYVNKSNGLINSIKNSVVIVWDS